VAHAHPHLWGEAVGCSGGGGGRSSRKGKVVPAARLERMPASGAAEGQIRILGSQCSRLHRCQQVGPGAAGCTVPATAEDLNPQQREGASGSGGSGERREKKGG
jgi:hypothetical protein